MARKPKGSVSKYNTRSMIAKRLHFNFRSTIAPLVKDIEELKKSIKKRHILAIRETSFRLIFMALLNDRLRSNIDTRKGNKNIVKILDSYDPIQKGFLIGDQCLSITARDIAVIFGIPEQPIIQKKGKKLSITLEKVAEEFVDRYFTKGRKIKRDQIMKKLRILVKIGSKEAMNDFKVLTCSLICCTLFFHNSTGVLPKVVIKELYSYMDQTSWAEKILETLMMNVEKYKP